MMAGWLRISAYRFGSIEVDGQTYSSDLIVLPSGVRSNWRRAEGHILNPDDLSAVLSAAPRVLVVGQGAHGMMKVTDETLSRLREVGIETVCARTARAVEIYNDRCEQGEAVAAALHLTC